MDDVSVLQFLHATIIARSYARLTRALSWLLQYSLEEE
jgi:hypothetical protein